MTNNDIDIEEHNKLEEMSNSSSVHALFDSFWL